MRRVRSVVAPGWIIDLDGDGPGRWSRTLTLTAPLTAPHPLHVEVELSRRDTGRRWLRRPLSRPEGGDYLRRPRLLWHLRLTGDRPRPWSAEQRERPLQALALDDLNRALRDLVTPPPPLPEALAALLGLRAMTTVRPLAQLFSLTPTGIGETVLGYHTSRAQPDGGELTTGDSEHPAWWRLAQLERRADLAAGELIEPTLTRLTTLGFVSRHRALELRQELLVATALEREDGTRDDRDDCDHRAH